MIAEDYCSYEVAKLLEEKGFNENTICKYADIGGITERYYDDYRQRVLRFHYDEGYLIEPSTEPEDQYEIIGNTIPASTHQMAMKWLRKIYGFHISVAPYLNNEGEVIWVWEIINIETATIIADSLDSDDFNSCEEAVEAALKYCLTYML